MSSHRHRRPRWPLWLAITLVVLVGLFVAADRVAVAVAQSAAAKTLQSSEHLDTRPTVRIAGFPFLTQIIGRKLSHVTVTDDHVTVGSNGRTLQLQKVDVSLHTLVVSNDLRTVRARTATASAVVPYSELTRILGVTVSYVADASGSSSTGGKVQATKTVVIAGQEFSGTVTAKVAVVNGVLQFGSATVGGAAAALPPQVVQALEGAFNDNIALSGLPFHLYVTTVAAQPQGIVFGLSGADLVYRR